MASSTEHPRTSERRPSRRALLASAALVAPVSLLPAIAAAAETSEDPLVPLGREFLALNERFHELGREGRDRWAGS